MQDALKHCNQALETAYEEIQSTNEELETTNEELQSSNEELETANEELQSTNEELETMNEELQATNEELQTANEELHQRGDELNHVNTFLGSILSSMPEGVIVLDAELHTVGRSLPRVGAPDKAQSSPLLFRYSTIDSHSTPDLLRVVAQLWHRVTSQDFGLIDANLCTAGGDCCSLGRWNRQQGPERRHHVVESWRRANLWLHRCRGNR